MIHLTHRYLVVIIIIYDEYGNEIFKEQTKSIKTNKKNNQNKKCGGIFLISISKSSLAKNK